MNRRALAKGAAWALPVVTVAAAAPSLADSLSGLEVGLAIWGACFLTGVVYLLASLRTFREHTRTIKARPHCTWRTS